MSLADVAQFAARLPPRFRDDILTYSRSVQDSLPEIFRDAGIKEDEYLADQLVFAAGIKKLHAICSRAFWILDSSLEVFRESKIEQVRIGSLTIARGSPMWLQLQETLEALEAYLAQKEILWLVGTNSYSEILLRLTDERRRG